MKFKETDLASRIRDELYDDWEKVLLNTIVGTRFIDIASKLLNKYGNYELQTTNKEEFLDRFAAIKCDSNATIILNQLKTFSEELEKLTSPKYFYKEGESEAKSNTQLINDFESKNDTKDATGNYNYLFNENSNLSRAGTLVRGASTQTSQKNKGIENKWKKDALLDVKSKLVTKKKIDIEKLLSDDSPTLNAEDVPYVLMEEEDKEPEEVGGELYSLMNVGLTGTVTSNYNSSGNENLAITKGKANTTSTSNTYSDTEYKVEKGYKSYVHNDATLRVLRLNIANLQSKYFNLFCKHELFKL